MIRQPPASEVTEPDPATDADLMGAALDQARRALAAGEFPVGCVAAGREDGRIIVTGARVGTATARPNEVDHAEMVALRRLAALPDAPPPSAICLYVTLEPCLMCHAAMMLTGISRVVYAYEDVMGGGTACPLDALPPLYVNRRMTIVPHVRRRESLELFQTYFAAPENAYWRDSILARYTLDQQ